MGEATSSVLSRAVPSTARDIVPHQMDARAGRVAILTGADGLKRRLLHSCTGTIQALSNFRGLGRSVPRYISVMADILLRGVPESAVSAIKQQASDRGVAPGEFITRLLNFYLLLSEPEVPAQVVAARRESKLQAQ